MAAKSNVGTGTGSNIVDSGTALIPLMFHIDTSGMKKGEQVFKHIRGDHLAQHAGIAHIDLLNARSIALKGTSDNLGAFAVDLIHELPNSKNPNGELVQTVEKSAYTISDGDKSTVLHQSHANMHNNWPSDETKLTLVPSTEQDAKHKNSNTKKLSSAWSQHNDKDSLLAGAVGAGIDKKGINHILVTAVDEETKQPSAVYTLLQRNPTNTKLLGGRYRHGISSIHTTHNGQHAYKMTEADFHEAVANLWDSLTTHSPFSKGIGVRVTKISGDVTVPVMRNGTLVIDEKTKEPKTKVVDATTMKPTGATTVKLLISRQPMDPVLGFIPNEMKHNTTFDHIAAWTNVGGASGQVNPKPSPAGFESKFFY